MAILNLLTLALSLAAGVNGAPSAVVPRQSKCNRAALLAAADAYVAAQTAGSLSGLTSLMATGSFSYVENNVKKDVATGVLSKAIKIDNRRTIVDMTECATYTELIAASNRPPYVIGTQIHHSPTDNFVSIALIDSVASTTGSWLFNATGTLYYARQEKWDPIPPEKQDTREHIKAAGDAYMDLWSSATAKDRVPWGTPCNRLEGGVYTGRGLPTDSCAVGIPTNTSQAPNSNRRYVIDESMGSVSILCLWEHMMNAADSHEFRLENGKLRYIHTITECGGRTCRL